MGTFEPKINLSSPAKPKTNDFSVLFTETMKNKMGFLLSHKRFHKILHSAETIKGREHCLKIVFVFHFTEENSIQQVNEVFSLSDRKFFPTKGCKLFIAPKTIEQKQLNRTNQLEISKNSKLCFYPNK